MTRIPMTSAAVAAVCIALSFVPGCNMPTKEQYAALEKQADEAAAALEKADDTIAVLEGEKAKTAKAQEASESRVSALKAAQSEIAGQLANADGALRDALTASMRRIDRDIESERSTAAAVGATLADVEERIGKLAIERERASKKLDDTLAQADILDEQARKSVADALAGVKGLGEIAGNFGVPGAGMVTNQLVDTFGGLLGGLLPGAGAALIYRRQRNGARRAIANTERHGIDAIANDPAVRAKAKADLSADPVARKEYALAKAGA